MMKKIRCKRIILAKKTTAKMQKQMIPQKYSKNRDLNPTQSLLVKTPNKKKSFHY